MQTLDVISINIWQIVISLCNLLLLFLMLKRFLYKPVKRVLQERRNDLEKQYNDASEDRKAAQNCRSEWERKMKDSKQQGEEIVKNAVKRADMRSDSIISQANEKADSIVRDAKSEAELERKKAQAEIKKEIVDISALLTEKMLSREINTQDHRELIDSVISHIGDDDDTDK